jgi:beta-lactamase class C
LRHLPPAGLKEASALISLLALALALSPDPNPDGFEPPMTPAQTSAQPPAWLDTFETRLDQVADHERMVGFAAAIIENGEVVATFTSGETALGSGEAVTEDTLFRAASVTKTFTGTLLAALEAGGMVDLDQPAPNDLIRLNGARQPTWRELVSHQTGLPPNAYDNLIEAGQDADRVRARLADVDLICQPGQCYTYQNVAFAAVESLIENATGLPYEAAVETYLLDPLGLDDAGFGEAHLSNSESWARPHRGRLRRLGGAATDYDTLPAAAGLSVSLNDMIAWAQAHIDAESGLPQDVINRAFTPQTRSARETRNLRRLQRVDDTAYGLGWRIYEWDDRTLVAHGGALAGYGSHIVLEPETGFAFVALWNADFGLPRLLWPTAMDLRTGDGPGDFIDQALERMRQ